MQNIGPKDFKLWYASKIWKTKWCRRGITILSNLGGSNSRKYSTQFEGPCKLQACCLVLKVESKMGPKARLMKGYFEPRVSWTHAIMYTKVPSLCSFSLWSEPRFPCFLIDRTKLINESTISPSDITVDITLQITKWWSLSKARGWNWEPMFNYSCLLKTLQHIAWVLFIIEESQN